VACRDMKSTHAGMVDDKDSPITIADFDALLVDVVTAAGTVGVDTESDDFGAIAGALCGMCGDIVGEGEDCATSAVCGGD